MIAALATPWSACADEYAAVRTRFRVAYAAAQSGGAGSTDTDDDALRAYPLYPYLQAARLEYTWARTRRSPSSSTSTARRPISAACAARGSRISADAGSGKLTSSTTRTTVDTNVTLRCYALTARAALGRDDGLEEAIAAQWLTAAQPS